MNRLVFASLLGVTFFFGISVVVVVLAMAYCLLHGYTITLSVLELAMWPAIKAGAVGGGAMFLVGCLSPRNRKSRKRSEN